MSCTEIYKFDKKGDAVFLGETKNSYRGAMAVWDYLNTKYLPKYTPEFAKYFKNTVEKVYHRSSDPTGEAIKEVWDLQNNDKVSIVDKICLLSTFDNVIVYRKDIPSLLEAFRKFEGCSSLKEQADLIEQELENDKDFIAIGWNQTSVNYNMWSYMDDVDFDNIEDKDDIPPYNILNINSKRHWSLFGE